MKSKMFFRETGQVISTRSRWAGLQQALWGAVGVVAVVGLMAVGAGIDSADEAAAVAAEAQQFEAGRMAEQQASVQRVAVAYRQGYSDALAELARARVQDGPQRGAAVVTSANGSRP